MKTLLTVLLVSLSSPALAWSTTADYASDFAKARECRPLDGRRLWVGGSAFYIQSWLFRTPDSGLLDDDAVSAVPFDDNSMQALATFAALCK